MQTLSMSTTMRAMPWHATHNNVNTSITVLANQEFRGPGNVSSISVVNNAQNHYCHIFTYQFSLIVIRLMKINLYFRQK